MKPFDLSKLRKNITKNIEGVSFGFTNPTVWFSTGCYTLNWLLTKDFKKGFPLDGKINIRKIFNKIKSYEKAIQKDILKERRK
jgi:hypothetical protein